MYGSTLSRSCRASCNMVLHPCDAMRWVRNRFVLKEPLDQGIPWFSWRAIDYTIGILHPLHRVFEWRGGGSTIFFPKELKELLVWRVIHTGENVLSSNAGLLEKPIKNVILRYIPAETQEMSAIQAYVMSVHDGSPWDIINIDGLEESYLSRLTCLQEAKECFNDDGIIILDDAWRVEYRKAPQILESWRKMVFRGLGPSRWGVTQTDLYFRP